MTDTIAAIATPQGPGGIGIIRISGADAKIIAKRLFRQKKPLNWSQLRGRHITYGAIHSLPLAGNEFNPVTKPDGLPIDEAICLIFTAPHSYTGEDVIEFQCHGGPAVLRQVLDSVFAAGARPAEPGEFTRRAYLNGRIDLTRAEAVMQLVTAASQQAARAANAAMGGALSTKIAELRQQLITLAAHISAWVDYPDEDIPALQNSELAAILAHVAFELTALLRRAPRDQQMLSGVPTALLGKPNVGKSSLMNLLLGYDRSIVTDIPGTTRDTVTETLPLGRLTLRLTDTAGLRDSDEAIEQAGIARSRAAMAQAELLLAVCDASVPLTAEDHALLAACDPTRTLLIRNKCDLPPVWQPPAGFRKVDMSALTGQGTDVLAAAAEELLEASQFSPYEAILANRRQSDCAAAALAALEEAQAAQAAGYPLDALSVCIEDAIQALYSLTGERAADAVVDEVFAQFCVGK